MKKKLLSAMLISAMMLSFAACGSPDDPSGDTDGLTLTLMGKKSDLQKSYMSSIFDLYESTTGNELEIISIDDADFEKEAAKRFEEGDAPDLFMHFNNADLNSFDVADNFVYLNDQPWKDDLTESAAAYCMDKDGNLLGLPFWENSVSGCYYNKTILDSMGLKPAATQTEFDSLCQALADTGYTPICWPADGCSWMTQFGLDPVFADQPELLEKLNGNQLTYADIPAVKDMVQWLSDARKKGWFGDDYADTGWDDIAPALGSGDAVMAFIWDTWFYTDFSNSERYTVNDFALMPVFMGTAEAGTYEGGNLNMMMVNKNGEQVDAALDFLSFCASEENYNAAFESISTVNCFKGQTTNIQSRMVTDAAASIAKNERVSTAASRIYGYNAEDALDALNKLFSGQVDVDGCIELLDRYRIEEAQKQGIEGF